MPRMTGMVISVEGFKVPAGPTLLTTMWDDLIRTIDDLMQDEDYWDDDSGWDRKWTEGRAAGISWCIAVLTQSPGRPDISIVKEEAMARWQAEREAA